jgi:hypothetical protein
MTTAGIVRKAPPFRRSSCDRVTELMMVKATLAFLMLFFTTATAAAQEARQRTDVPPLIRDTTPQVNDSPLVRAARAAVAARNRAAGSRTVIDDRTVRRGRIYQANVPLTSTLPVFPAEVQPLAATTAAPTADAIAARQRLEALKQEQQRTAEEADQGPYGETSEDDVERRLTQIPAEAAQAERDLQAATPPPSSR